jgi:putative transposase
VSVLLSLFTRQIRSQLCHRVLQWMRPTSHSLLSPTLTDLARTKSELLAENAALPKQLISLNRQVKRPTYAKTDRILRYEKAVGWKTWGAC